MLTKLIRTQTAKQEAQLENWLKTRTETIPFPADVRLYENLDYMGDGQMCHRMDVFVPADHTDALPLVIDLHGGGFFLGKKGSKSTFLCGSLQKGLRCVLPGISALSGCNRFCHSPHATVCHRQNLRDSSGIRR